MRMQTRLVLYILISAVLFMVSMATTHVVLAMLAALVAVISAVALDEDYDIDIE